MHQTDFCHSDRACRSVQVLFSSVHWKGLHALQGMGVVDSSLDKSHITMEELDARAQPAAGPRLPPRSAPKGLQGKRKGRR